LPQLPRRARKQPTIASVKYPPRAEGLTVIDFLDTSKALVKSGQPLTRPKGPSFVEETDSAERQERHSESKLRTALYAAQVNSQRTNERKYLKAQYEFEREKLLAERSIYHKERTNQWAKRLQASPLAVDLVADNERIEEEAFVRLREERRHRALAEKKRQRIKRAIIVKALSEVPLLEEARKQKRELYEDERREKAIRDVQRVEAVQNRKLREQDELHQERRIKVDQRVMSTTSSK